MKLDALTKDFNGKKINYWAPWDLNPDQTLYESAMLTITTKARNELLKI